MRSKQRETVSSTLLYMTALPLLTAQHSEDYDNILSELLTCQQHNEDINMAKDYHYFTSSYANWATDEDLLKCLEKQKKFDRKGSSKARGCRVFRVPVPASAHYKIDNYEPLVEGTKFIDNIAY